MIGQVEPLQVGTHIKAKLSEEKNDYIEYEIISYIAQGGSAIVYKALRYDTYYHHKVILKEYCPINIHSSNSYKRLGGVIVKKENDNNPICVHFRDLAIKELQNNQGCSKGGKSSKICCIDKIIFAYEIAEPDTEESYDWNGNMIGIFAEMESYDYVYSYQGIIEAIRNEIYALDENAKLTKELKGLLSVDTSSLSVNGIMTLMGSILKSVQTIHQNGWVHKDLKLSNMLFEKESGDKYLQGTTVLIDFGSSQRLIDGTDPLHAPKGDPPYTEGTTKGYQPPEILEENIDKYHYEGWTKASDIYQLGCIMYYMLCGKFPPTYLINEAELDRIDEILGEHHLSDPVFNLIKNMIFKSISSNPLQRYSDISAYKEDIEETSTQLSASAEAVNSNREIVRRADLNKIDNEDYAILFELFDEIKDKLIDAEYCDNNYTLAKNEEELNELGLLCITNHNRRATHECVKYGLIYLDSFHALYMQGYDINIAASIIQLFGQCVELLIGDGSGVQLAREAFRFYNLEITDPNLRIYHECPIDVKSMLYCGLFDTLDLGGINIENYYELKHILREWGKVLEDPFFDTRYGTRFNFTIRTIQLCIYDKNYSKAFDYIEQCKRYREYDESEYFKTSDALTIIMHIAAIYNGMHDFESSRDYALKWIDIYNNAPELVDNNRIKSNLYNAYYYLRNAYYYMDDADQAAYYTVQSIILMKDIMFNQPIQGKQKYKDSIDFAHKIYNPNVQTYNMDQLRLLMCEEKVKHTPTKIVPRSPISFDKISSSIVLSIGSAFIPKRMQPIAMKKLNDKQITNILNVYGNAIKKDDIVAVLDSSLSRNGKNVTVFTKEGICSNYFQTKRLIKYDELKDVAFTESGNIALTFNSGQYEENKLPEAKLLVAILKGETKIRI